MEFQTLCKRRDLASFFPKTFLPWCYVIPKFCAISWDFRAWKIVQATPWNFESEPNSSQFHGTLAHVAQVQWNSVEPQMFSNIVVRLNGPFACMPTIKLTITRFRTNPVWILYKPILLSHIIFDFVWNAGAYTCLCHKIHRPSYIGIVHIYFILAVVFIMICVLHVIYCRPIALVANVTCWLLPTLNKMVSSCLVSPKLPWKSGDSCMEFFLPNYCFSKDL